MNRILAALTIALSLATSAAHAADKPTFVFTAIPDSDETRLVERFTRVADYLQSKGLTRNNRFNEVSFLV
jgi:phosphonate transport system substrate-binding protein